MNRRQPQDRDLGVRELLKRFRESTSGLVPLTCSLRVIYLKIKGASNAYYLEFSQVLLTPDIAGRPAKQASSASSLPHLQEQVVDSVRYLLSKLFEHHGVMVSPVETAL